MIINKEIVPYGSYEEMVEAIKRVSLSLGDNEFTSISGDDIDTAVLNYEMFVRPGKNRMAFLHKLKENLDNARKKANLTPGTSVDENLRKTGIALIKQYFDVDYFEKQLIYGNRKCDRTLLHKFVYKLSKQQLLQFMRLILKGNRESGLFIRYDKLVEMWAEFNRQSRLVDSSIPSMDAPTEVYSAYVLRDPLYQFRCLQRKSIAGILFEYIAKDEDVAGELAKRIYSSSIAAAENYLFRETRSRRELLGNCCS